MEILKTKNVLFVEDNDDFAQNFMTLLELFVHKIWHCKDLSHARNIFTHEVVDMIICDIKLNNENGLSYLQRGGNFEYSSRRLAQWIGPVDEAVVPYSQADSTLESGLDDKYAYSYSKAHMKNAYEINIHENADEVKANIMEHGAAGVMYYHNDSAYLTVYKKLFTFRK